MKKRTIWRNLLFFGLWLGAGGVAIIVFAPEFFTARDAAPNTAAMPPATDIPPLDDAPTPQYYTSETSTAGSAAPSAVERTSDNSPGAGPLFASPGAAAPAAAAPETTYPGVWQYDTAALPGAGNSASGSYGNENYQATAAADSSSIASGGAEPDLPGAPAPDEPSDVAAAPATGSVGDADAIEDSSTNTDEPLGLSGSGEGGGGAGEGSIGLGSIGTIGHGGDTVEGYGSGRAGAAAHPQTREIVEDNSAKPPPPPDADDSAADDSAADDSAADDSAADDSTADDSTSDDAMSEVDRKLAALPLGNIAFNTPETIPLGNTATIELLVSMKEAEEQLRQSVHGLGPVETAHVQLSDQMEAKVAGLGFRIEPITPERQAVSHTQETRWRWQIEPTKSSTLELNLTLSALIKIDGEPSARAIRTFEKTIIVKVPFGQRVATAMSNNVELITSVVLIPVAGGTWRYFRKRKRGKIPPADDAEAPRRAA